MNATPVRCWPRPSCRSWPIRTLLALADVEDGGFELLALGDVEAGGDHVRDRAAGVAQDGVRPGDQPMARRRGPASGSRSSAGVPPGQHLARTARASWAAIGVEEQLPDAPVTDLLEA